jgi:putative transposase
MSKQRRRHSAESKFKVALEAAKGQKTINELAGEYGAHPTQVSAWKQELLEGGDNVFRQPNGIAQHELEALQSAENLQLMRWIDGQYTRTPFYGWPRMTAYLRQQRGVQVDHKRVQRLMQIMGLQAIFSKPQTSLAAPSHRIYPYLLRGLAIEHADQVCSTDITYIPMAQGFMYLVAILDWFTRYVVAWQLSNTLDGRFCLDALRMALQRTRPKIFNSDQGAQFTAIAFAQTLEQAGIRVSMDGRDRALDNIFVERLWRTARLSMSI